MSTAPALARSETEMTSWVGGEREQEPEEHIMNQRRLQEVEVSLNKRAEHNLRNTKINNKISKPIFRISWANFCTKKVSRVGISLTFPNFCPRNLQKKVLLLPFMLRHLVIFAFIR